MTTNNPFSQLDMFGSSPEPAPDIPPQKTIQAEPLKPATTAQTGLVFGQRPPTAAKGSDKQAGKEHKTSHRAARAMTPPPAPTRQIADAPALLRSGVLLAFLRACTAHAEDLHRQLVELEESASPQAVDHRRLADDARAFIESPALRAAIGLRALDLMVEQGGEIGITEPAPPTAPRSTSNEWNAQPGGGIVQPGSGTAGGDGQVLAAAAALAAPKVQHDENAWYRRTDRHAPIVRRVVIVGDQWHPYQPPKLDFRTTTYGTPFTIRVNVGEMDNTPARSIQQHMAYCVPTEDAERQLRQAHTAFADALNGLAAALRAAVSYAAALNAAGGAAKHPRPLTPTAIICEDPDHTSYYWTNWRVPQPERKMVKRHTPKMIQLGETTGLRMLGGVFCCADDTTWERVQAAHARAQSARNQLVELLKRQGTYEEAIADNRYRAATDTWLQSQDADEASEEAGGEAHHPDDENAADEPAALDGSIIGRMQNH